MWIYEKKLQYPVNIKEPNAALAKIIITQYGGPYGIRIKTKGRSLCLCPLPYCVTVLP